MIQKPIRKFYRTDTDFRVSAHDFILFPTLPSNVYELFTQIMSSEIIIRPMNILSDTLLDFPNPEYQLLLNQIKIFLHKTTKTNFTNLGFVYKRSFLLYGTPGSGKTCLINRIAKDIIALDGLVFFPEDINALVNLYGVLDLADPNRLIMVVLEEFDNYINDNDEEKLLKLLDGQIQKNNVLYFATTNFIETIPKRLLRPGRFSNVIQLAMPNKDVRTFYFKSKFGNDFKDLDLLVKKTDGLTIDELKEIVEAVYLLGMDLDTTLNHIKTTRDLGQNQHAASLQR